MYRSLLLYKSVINKTDRKRIRTFYRWLREDKVSRESSKLILSGMLIVGTSDDWWKNDNQKS